MPAPPVMTALPLMAKRARARSAAVPLWMLYNGAVRGFDAVDMAIVGIVRFVKASRASAGGAPGIPASPMLECVEVIECCGARADGRREMSQRNNFRREDAGA